MMASGPRVPVLASPKLDWLYRYWAERRGGRPYPARSNIDPIELRPLLGNIMLFDVVGSPPRFRYRLYGSSLAERSGYDMTGRWVDDLPDPDNAALVNRTLARLVESRDPISYPRERMLDGRLCRYEVLALPLSDDGLAINMILEGIAFADECATPMVAPGLPQVVRRSAAPA